MSQTIRVYVATHKAIGTALPDYCEKIQVNCAKNGRWEGYLHDDEGENISAKNGQYCELTALYSLWKNDAADIQGLFHYRRLIGEASALTLPHEGDKVTPGAAFPGKAIRRETILRELEEADVILPLPNCPYPTNAAEDLQRFCYPGDIRIMCEAVEELYPDYVPALEETLASCHLAYCNMFIARRAFVEGYCAWLFDVLALVESRVCLEGYDTGHQRIYGYLSEVLLNVYIRRHGLRVRWHYMVQLYEGNRYAVTAARRAVNLVLSLGGVYPYIRNRRLWQGRYRQMLAYEALGGGEPELSYPAAPEAMAARMREDGAASVETGGEDMPRVFARFAYALNNIAIATFLVPEPVPADLISRIQAEAEKLRQRLDPGETLLLRAGLADRDPETEEALRRAFIRPIQVK